MSYRDRTFCTYYNECLIGDNCSRALTPEVRKEADKWMENPRIAVYAKKPGCFQERKTQ